MDHGLDNGPVFIQDSKQSSKSQFKNFEKSWGKNNGSFIHLNAILFNILSSFNTVVSLKHGFGFPYAKPFTTFRNMLVVAY